MQKNQVPPSDSSRLDDSFEHPAWETIHGVWRPVYGGIFNHGVSLEWHDFRLRETLDWSRSFHEGGLEICLNFGGRGSIGRGKTARQLEPGQISVHSAQSAASRESDTSHRFFTLEVTPEFLHGQFGSLLGNLRPEVSRFIEHPEHAPGVLEQFPLPSTLLPLRLHLLEPPVFPSAQSTWYQSKVLEILAATIFEENKPSEFFCHQHKRLNRERAERARYLLERDLENPPSLDMLGAEIGCSPFHLSRIFTSECGVSIPKYLRMRRIEKSAELLREGKSVTEAAMEVGYSSLSAFIKAFVGHFGVLPGQFAAQGGSGAK